MSSPIKSWRGSKNRYQYLGQTGKILSLTEIKSPVSGFEKYLPYKVAIIQLGKGERITGQIVSDGESLVEGKSKKLINKKKVVGVLRRLKDPGKKEIVEYTVKWKVIKKSRK